MTNAPRLRLSFLALAAFFLLLSPALSASAARAGDRGLAPNVTFPDTLLVQNGGPVLDVKRPPEAGMHAAKGDGVSDDTAAFQDVWDYLKRAYKKFGPWGSDNSFYVYLPDGTYESATR